MKILIVEDDRTLSNLLKKELLDWGYEIDQINNFNNVLEEFKESEPQLVLLDIVLPFFNGYYWCQKIREISKVPIIFISSKNEDLNIIQAMQYGADDYIVKPINIDITRAKIQAILRREYDFSNTIDFIDFHDVRLHLLDSEIEYKDKKESLTRTELIIMEMLFKKNGAIATRDEIMDRCWQGDNFIDDNTLAVNMTRLRKKLSYLGLDNFIITRKGQGYQLSDEEL